MEAETPGAAEAGAEATAVGCAAPGEEGGLRLPPWPLAWRGLALAGMAAGLAVLGVRAVRWSMLAAPAGVVLGVGAVLAAWAAAIHLTGGERFDDGGCD